MVMKIMTWEMTVKMMHEDNDDGDGTALMSLADTGVEDHDETGLGDDEYNDDMADEEEDA